MWVLRLYLRLEANKKSEPIVNSHRVCLTERAVRALEWPYECLNVWRYLDRETPRGTEGGRLLQSKG